MLTVCSDYLLIYFSLFQENMSYFKRKETWPMATWSRKQTNKKWSCLRYLPRTLQPVINEYTKFKPALYRQIKMASASLSIEEENYVRMSLLLTGVSPRGVRTLFDSEFAPNCLDASIKKEYTKLKDLQLKHRINQSQWNLMFPRFPG